MIDANEFEFFRESIDDAAKYVGFFFWNFLCLLVTHIKITLYKIHAFEKKNKRRPIFCHGKHFLWIRLAYCLTFVRISIATWNHVICFICPRVLHCSWINCYHFLHWKLFLTVEISSTWILFFSVFFCSPHFNMLLAANKYFSTKYLRRFISCARIQSSPRSLYLYLRSYEVWSFSGFSLGLLEKL